MRSATSREAWTGLTCAETWPLRGYIEPLQPAHQNIWSIGSFAVEATQSAAQAAAASGLAKSATSGLRIEVSAESCQSGSSSVT